MLKWHVCTITDKLKEEKRKAKGKMEEEPKEQKNSENCNNKEAQNTESNRYLKVYENY